MYEERSNDEIWETKDKRKYWYEDVDEEKAYKTDHRFRHEDQQRNSHHSRYSDQGYHKSHGLPESDSNHVYHFHKENRNKKKLSLNNYHKYKHLKIGHKFHNSDDSRSHRSIYHTEKGSSSRNDNDSRHVSPANTNRNSGEDAERYPNISSDQYYYSKNDKNDFDSRYDSQSRRSLSRTDCNRQTLRDDNSHLTDSEHAIREAYGFIEELKYISQDSSYDKILSDPDRESYPRDSMYNRSQSDHETSFEDYDKRHTDIDTRQSHFQSDPNYADYAERQSPSRHESAHYRRHDNKESRSRSPSQHSVQYDERSSHFKSSKTYDYDERNLYFKSSKKYDHDERSLYSNSSKKYDHDERASSSKNRRDYDRSSYSRDRERSDSRNLIYDDRDERTSHASRNKPKSREQIRDRDFRSRSGEVETDTDLRLAGSNRDSNLRSKEHSRDDYYWPGSKEHHRDYDLRPASKERHQDHDLRVRLNRSKDRDHRSTRKYTRDRDFRSRSKENDDERNLRDIHRNKDYRFDSREKDYQYKLKRKGNDRHSPISESKYEKRYCSRDKEYYDDKEKKYNNNTHKDYDHNKTKSWKENSDLEGLFDDKYQQKTEFSDGHTMDRDERSLDSQTEVIAANYLDTYQARPPSQGYLSNSQLAIAVPTSSGYVTDYQYQMGPHEPELLQNYSTNNSTNQIARTDTPGSYIGLAPSPDLINHLSAASPPLIGPPIQQPFPFPTGSMLPQMMTTSPPPLPSHSIYDVSPPSFQPQMPHPGVFSIQQQMSVPPPNLNRPPAAAYIPGIRPQGLQQMTEQPSLHSLQQTNTKPGLLGPPPSISPNLLASNSALVGPMMPPCWNNPQLGNEHLNQQQPLTSQLTMTSSSDNFPSRVPSSTDFSSNKVVGNIEDLSRAKNPAAVLASLNAVLAIANKNAKNKDAPEDTSVCSEGSNRMVNSEPTRNADEDSVVGQDTRYTDSKESSEFSHQDDLSTSYDRMERNSQSYLQHSGRDAQDSATQPECSGPRFRCRKCNTFFPSEFRRQRHEDFTCTGNYQGAKCAFCWTAFVRFSDLLEHLQKTHVSELPHVCCICRLALMDEKSINTHMISHITSEEITEEQMLEAVKEATREFGTVYPGHAYNGPNS